MLQYWGRRPYPKWTPVKKGLDNTKENENTVDRLKRHGLVYIGSTTPTPTSTIICELYKRRSPPEEKGGERKEAKKNRIPLRANLI
jgi:hypothetical protein